MILECDIGNTRCKWRLLDPDDGGRLDAGVFAHAEGFASLADLGSVSRVRAASVVAASVVEQFDAKCRQYLGIDVEHAISAACCAGIENAYADPETLGVDRWLAMVAAYNQSRRAVVVIDVGSALTIDVVDSQGRHQGGYIIPGKRMMEDSLFANTGRVTFDREKLVSKSCEFGCSTDLAVGHGTLAALVGVVEVSLEGARRVVGSEFDVWLTGGDALLLRPLIIAGHYYAPELVMDGLAYALP
jgi:type III pantothenate kinase